MKRLVSGVQPTGQLHLGNYLGAIKQWLDFTDDYDCYFFIADLHALNERPEPQKLRENTYQTLAMLLALGLDPKKTVLFAQSQVPAHSELSWILGNFVGLGALDRMTQFKEKSARTGQNAGLYNYPILMSADVLLYQAESVPVGDDQLQHLELTREIARSFNQRYSTTFIEPKPLISSSSRVMALNDPAKKMSKSVPGSAVGLLDDEETITRLIKRSVTDSDPNAAHPSPAIANLLTLLSGLATPETVQRFEKLREDGRLRYSELKEQLIEDTVAFLRPVQKTFQQLIEDQDNLTRIFTRGAEAARAEAAKTIEQVKKNVGLIAL